MRRVLLLALAILVGSAGTVAADPAREAEAFALRAETDRLNGNLDAALADLGEARRLARTAGDRGLMAAIASMEAEVRIAAGQARAAAGEIEASLNEVLAAGEAADARTASAALNTLGALRGGDAALQAYLGSLALAERAGDARMAATAAINAARLHLGRGAPAEAEAMLARSSAALDRAPEDAGKAFLLIAQGMATTEVMEATRQSRPDLLRHAHRSLSEGERIADAAGDRRARSQALGHLARLYGGQGRADEASTLTDRAIFLAQEAAAPDLLLRWHWQAGRLHRAAGRLPEAVAAYDLAVENLRLVRPDLLRAAGGYGSPFRTIVGPLFQELADLELRLAAAEDDPRAAQRHLVSARDAVERIKAAELEDYFQDDCVASLRAKARSIDQVAPTTAVLYPILLPDRLEILVGLADGIRQVTVPVGGEEVGAVARRFRGLLEQRTNSRFLADARRLHDWLIRPVETVLEGRPIDTLVLVPDGPLRAIPLAALHDGRRFLVERFALAVAPGLSLLEPRALATGEAEFLLAGLTKAVQGFPALPHVTAELSAIRDLTGATMLADSNFVTGRIREALSRTPFSVVHIASHGKFEREADDSFILTFDGRLSMDQLESFVKLSQFRDEPVELLTLSACQTAAGDDRAALGLAGIAIKAGARSALASLWFINDQAASQLIADFYRNLGSGTPSKAEALRRAQIGLIRDLRYRHPGYWAAFLLIGNWL